MGGASIKRERRLGANNGSWMVFKGRCTANKGVVLASIQVNCVSLEERELPSVIEKRGTFTAIIVRFQL